MVSFLDLEVVLEIIVEARGSFSMFSVRWRMAVTSNPVDVVEHSRQVA
jgi:hypothetical protein